MKILKMFQFVSSNLKNNFDLAIYVIDKFSGALQWVSSELKNNKEIVKIAVLNDKKVYKYVGKKIRKEYPTVNKFLASEV